MGKRITDVKIAELSLIFGDYKGQQWAPINPEAKVLDVKGAPQGEKSLLASLVDRFQKKGWLVKDDAPDNIDGDGDASEDYERIASIITGLYYDIGSCYSIGDNDARSMAVTTAIDNFLANLDDIRTGGDGMVAGYKAGAKHSKETKAHIDAMSDAHKTMGEHLDALKAGAKKDDEADTKGAPLDVQTEERDGNVVVTAVGVKDEKGEPVSIEIGKADYDDAEKRDAALKQLEEKAKAAKATPTELAVTVASDTTAVTALIAKAAADFDAKLAAAKTESEAAIKAQVDTVKAEAQTQIDAAKAAAETQNADLKAKLDAVTTRAETAEKAIKAMGAEAAKPSAPGFVPTVDEDGRHDPAREVNKASALGTEPRTIADVIALQRIAAS